MVTSCRVSFTSLAVFFVILAASSRVRGEPDEKHKAIVQEKRSQHSQFVPAAVPQRVAIGEGAHNHAANRISHLQPKVPPTYYEGSPRLDVGESRKSRKSVLRRLALPLLILILVKAGLALPVLFGGVALAAFKGMWTGSSAFFMTSMMALKHLIPAPKIIVPNGHANVQDYVATEYRRSDPFHRDDYSSYGGYGYK